MQQFFFFIATTLLSLLIAEVLSLSPALVLLCLGIVISPSFLNLLTVSDPIIYVFSEIGIILFVFSIGLELPFSRLKNLLNKTMYWGGLQMSCTSLVCFCLLTLCTTWELIVKVVLSLGVSLSSTALVVNLISQEKPLESHKTWKSLFPTLLFQDMIAIGVLIFLNIYKSFRNNSNATAIYNDIGIFFSIFILTLISLYFILQQPKMQNSIIVTDEKITLVFFITLALGLGLLTEHAQMSLELGAFVGGILCAELFDIHAIESSMSPLLNLGMAAFFLQIGMQLDWCFFNEHRFSIVGLTLLLSLIKACVLFVIAYAHGFPWKLIAKFTIPLSSVSEFMFVIMKQSKVLDIDPITSKILMNSISFSLIFTSIFWYIFTMVKNYQLARNYHKNQTNTLLTMNKNHG